MQIQLQNQNQDHVSYIMFVLEFLNYFIVVVFENLKNEDDRECQTASAVKIIKLHTTTKVIHC